jgi:competence protein CoiA
MRYAIVNGEKSEATARAKGHCCGCGEPVKAYCGKKNAPHWRHPPNSDCVSGSEPETPWHVAWKDHFPVEHQEVSFQDQETGRRFRADVHTYQGWTIEIQHSPISTEDRDARNKFYKRIVWIVSAMRRKKDVEAIVKTFTKSQKFGRTIAGARVTSKLPTILEEWRNTGAPVFIDIGDPEFLILLYPQTFEGSEFLLPVEKAELLTGLRSNREGRNQGCLGYLNKWLGYIVDHNRDLRTFVSKQKELVKTAQMHNVKPRNQIRGRHFRL